MQIDGNIDLTPLVDALAKVRQVASEREMRSLERSLANRAVALNRTRIRQQRNLDGSKFAQRSDKVQQADERRQLKMFARILNARTGQIGIEFTDNGIKVSAVNPVAGKHHYGMAIKMDANKLEQQAKAAKAYHKAGKGERFLKTRDEAKQDPCSDRQADVLMNEVGIQTVTVNKKKQAATRELIQQQFTIAEAGWVIRKSRLAAGQNPKTKWTVLTPSRHILGLSEDMVPKLEDSLIKRMHKKGLLPID